MLVRHYWLFFFKQRLQLGISAPYRCSACPHAPIYDQLVRVRKSCPFSPENSCGVSWQLFKTDQLQDLWMERNRFRWTPTQTGQKPLVFQKGVSTKNMVIRCFVWFCWKIAAAVKSQRSYWKIFTSSPSLLPFGFQRFPTIFPPCSHHFPVFPNVQRYGRECRKECWKWMDHDITEKNKQVNKDVVEDYPWVFQKPADKILMKHEEPYPDFQVQLIVVWFGVSCLWILDFLLYV